MIYVFSGDGTTTGTDAGITLKNNQKLFGAGIDQRLVDETFGPINIPAQGVGLPKITGASGFIHCANNNEISGIHAIINEGATTGIVCDETINAFIHNNIIDGSAIISGHSLSGLLALTFCSGEINVTNNTFLIGNAALSDALFGVHLFSSVTGTTYLFNKNQF